MRDSIDKNGDGKTCGGLSAERDTPGLRIIGNVLPY
jgi:hypothetical protein